MFTRLQHCSGPHEGALAQIDKSGAIETVTYLHTDHLATPRYGTNAAGSTVWTWDSGAFGKEAPTGSATVNLRFPGQYYDAETTLHYNWNRYYNPATGRYISSDPIGLEGGLNTYLYVSANPLIAIDPEGLTREQMDRVIIMARVWSEEKPPYEYKVEDLPGDTLGEYHLRDRSITYDSRYADNEMNCVALEEFFVTVVHEAIHRREHHYLGPDKKNYVLGQDDPRHKWVYDQSIRELTRAKRKGLFSRFFPKECGKDCKACKN